MFLNRQIITFKLSFQDKFQQTQNMELKHFAIPQKHFSSKRLKHKYRSSKRLKRRYRSSKRLKTQKVESLRTLRVRTAPVGRACGVGKGADDLASLHRFYFLLVKGE